MDLKAALQYIVGLGDTKTFEIDGKTYADSELKPVEEPRYYLRGVQFGSLDAIIKMVKAELKMFTDSTYPMYIRVTDYKTVDVFSAPDDRAKREWPYSAVCEDTSFREGYRTQQEAIIELRSRFLPTPDVDYLLSLISTINNEQGVRSEDNGVTQTITAKSGVSMLQNVDIKPRVSLQPFRTFREIPQPESEFILRLDERGNVGLFEADGGMWKMEAKDNIMSFLTCGLREEIESGLVVIMV